MSRLFLPTTRGRRKTKVAILKMFFLKDIYWMHNELQIYRGLSAPHILYTQRLVLGCLHALDTIGDCQRPVFSLGVFQHNVHKITNLWTFELNIIVGFRSCEKIMEEKHHCHTKLCAFRCFISGPKNLIMRSRNQIRGKLPFFSKTTFTREGAVSHNVLYYQQLPITCYEVRFYASKYFE